MPRRKREGRRGGGLDLGLDLLRNRKMRNRRVSSGEFYLLYNILYIVFTNTLNVYASRVQYMQCNKSDANFLDISHPR
jgi:hypothetical protein